MLVKSRLSSHIQVCLKSCFIKELKTKIKGCLCNFLWGKKVKVPNEPHKLIKTLVKKEGTKRRRNSIINTVEVNIVLIFLDKLKTATVYGWCHDRTEWKDWKSHASTSYHFYVNMLFWYIVTLFVFSIVNIVCPCGLDCLISRK